MNFHILDLSLLQVLIEAPNKGSNFWPRFDEDYNCVWMTGHFGCLDLCNKGICVYIKKKIIIQHLYV